jgi:1-Cys peroxiredoxin 6
MCGDVDETGVLRLGNLVPDFSCDTTQGKWTSFHEWLGTSWGILFSHPADFTPVCTTEIGRLALKYKWLTERDVKVRCDFFGFSLIAFPLNSHFTS